MRGDRKKQQEMEGEKVTIEDSRIIDTRNYKPKRIPQLMWRECTPRALLSGRIKKVWEVDPLTCPKCAGEMKIISFIYKKTVIRKILTHLGVYQERQNQRAPPAVPPDYTGQVEIVPYDDGWPEYEEAVFDF